MCSHVRWPSAVGSTQQHWPFPSGKEETGYAYLMTHPGIPCVLWEHYYDYGKKDVIDKLIDIRSAHLWRIALQCSL